MALRNKKLWFAFLLLAFIVGLYFFTPIKDYLSKDNIDQLKLWIESRGPLAPVMFVGIYVAATILCLPGSVFTLLGGVLFGLGWGLALVVIAANIGAMGAFFIARYLGRDAAERLLRGNLGKLDEGIASNGFYVVLWLRLIPLFPFNALNYGLGLTQVKTRACFFANLFGMLPGTFVYVSLGNAAANFSLTDPSVWTRLEVWGPFALVILLSFLPKLFKKKQQELKNVTGGPS
jgi:uncharacterized membrane protein YdjX (TVP38/TMEM64 family)